MKNGYYTARADSLLRDFDETALLTRARLAPGSGSDFADMLILAIREEFERLIPEIPHIAGLRALPLNAFLRATAQELAVYRAMKKLGRSADEAWEVCHEAIVAKMEAYPAWKIWLLHKLMFSGLMKRRVRKRAASDEPLRLGDFEVRYLLGDGDNFDWGVDYVGCANYEFMKSQGAGEFAPYVCMSDIALSEALGWGLTRTQTLADGCECCDFRFKEGAVTHISSRTPEVQTTIERIRGRHVLEPV